MKGMTVIVLMWEEAAIKDDVIEYDIAFNIIYIMRTHVVVAKLRCPSLLAIHGPLTSDVKTRRTSAISLTCSSEI